MKKYYLNLYDNTADDMYEFSFTDSDIKKCQNGQYWCDSAKKLSTGIVKHFTKGKKLDNLSLATITCLLKTKTFLDEPFDYKEFNCFTFFVEPEVFEFVGGEIAKNKKDAVHISCEVLFTVL